MHHTLQTPPWLLHHLHTNEILGHAIIHNQSSYTRTHTENTIICAHFPTSRTPNTPVDNTSPQIAHTLKYKTYTILQSYEQCTHS